MTTTNTITAIATTCGCSDSAVLYAAFLAAGGRMTFDADYLGDGNVSYHYHAPNDAAMAAVNSVGVDNIVDFVFDDDMF
jgi:hypothetical protein